MWTACGFAMPPVCVTTTNQKVCHTCSQKVWYMSHEACLRHTTTWHDYGGVHMTRLSLMAAIKAGVKIVILHVCTKARGRSWDDFQLRVGPACRCQAVSAIWEDSMLQTHLSLDTAANNDCAFALGFKMQGIACGIVDSVYCLLFDSKEGMCYAVLLPKVI